MEVTERSRSPSRRTSRVEQVVGRWLRRSRDSSSRERTLGDGRPGEPGEPGEPGGTGGSDQRGLPLRITLQVAWDPALRSHGFCLSTHTPVHVQDVTAGGPADGKLVPGDQVLMINNITIEDLPIQQATDIIRDCHESVTLTILRHTVSPKSSFITAEKRARLKTNPVKVRFAEEVVVNGHSQGNSLLFLPNVLKVYLENGQTKAFKFEAKTTVKDIVLTLKEKLSIHCIEYFALMLEQHYSITKLFLLHEDELIRQVVQKREPHDYRCLFRVCFMPKDLLDMLQQDPVAFEYLYLQSVNDVLQERFAVEMKCNMALRLAALHVRERLISSGQTQKASLKSITKNWGIESFVSPTLLKNMKQKDLRKSLRFHMKKTQDLEPRSKAISVTEARLNFLTELAELKCFGAKTFSSTMMLQDRESMVCLLVGAKYGISHLINHKHHITATLAEFSSISRVELLPESEKVSLVKVYMQDIKPITLMLECQAAKDLSCMVAGYCKLMVDPVLSVFPWDSQLKEHRISAEEGYVSRGCSDSEESSEMEGFDMPVSSSFSVTNSMAEPLQEEQNEEMEMYGEHCEAADWKINIGAASEPGGQEEIEDQERTKVHENEEALSEASDSCRTDSRFISSCSSDSMDALEEDDLMTCSSSLPVHLQGSYLQNPPAEQAQGGGETTLHAAGSLSPCVNGEVDPTLCYAQLSMMAHCLPSPPEASDEEDGDAAGWPPHQERVFTFEEQDARHYYKICSNVTPNSACSLPKACHDCSFQEKDAEPAPILQPPPGFQDSSSEDEFFDAHDRLSSPEFAEAKDVTTGLFSSYYNMEGSCKSRTPARNDVSLNVLEHLCERGGVSGKTSRKRRSFLDSDFTSQVSFPHRSRDSEHEDQVCCYESERAGHNPCPTVSSLNDAEGEPAQLESKPIPTSVCCAASSQNRANKNKQLSSSLIEMEPDAMEYKSVTEQLTAASHMIHAVRCRVAPPEGKESSWQQKDDGDCATGAKDRLFSPHIFMSEKGEADKHCIIETGSNRPILKAVRDMMKEKHNAMLIGQVQVKKPDSRLPGDQSPVHLYRKEEGAWDFGQTVRAFPAEPLSPVLSLPAETPTSHISSVENQGEDSCDEEAHFSIQDLCEETSGSPFVPIHKNFSHSFESLVSISTDDFGSSCNAVRMTGATPKDLRCFAFQGCTTALVDRLSTSTLRCKIQSLQWLLSRSQEALISKSESSPRCEVTSESATKVNEQAAEMAEITVEETGEEADDLTVVAEEALGFFDKATDVGLDPHILVDLKSDTCLLNRAVLETDALLAIHHHAEPTTQPGEGVMSPRSALPEHTDPSPEILGGSQQCESVQPQPRAYPSPKGMATLESHSELTQRNPATLEEPQIPPEACGCQTVYTNCFHSVLDRNEFDEELTVYEFSCRAQEKGGATLLNTPPDTVSSSSSSLSSNSRNILLKSSSVDLSPVASPLEPLDLLEDTLNQLRNRHYRLPGGFLLLQQDIGRLLGLLERAPPGRGQHHQETCSSHFLENKQLLRAESRKLMSLCQRVIRVGQSSGETLQALADSFRTLVQLASVCLWFSSCGRCQRRHAEVLENLRDITRAYEEFSQVAERASGRKSCHDIVIKLLARQCTSLTAAVFCLTQLFRTRTDL